MSPRSLVLPLVLAACASRDEPSPDTPDTVDGRGVATAETGHTGLTVVDPPTRPPPEVTLLEEVVCAEPAARADQAFDAWIPAGAWADEPWDDGAVALFTGGGLTVVDVDEDGDLDVFLPQLAGGLHWLALGPDGAVDRSDELPAVVEATSAVTAVDVDADGELELFVGVWRGADRLFDRVDGTWVDTAEARGLAGEPGLRSGAASFADVDGDGDLDAFVAAHGDLGPDGTVLPDGDPSRLLLQDDDGVFHDLVPALAADHPLRRAHTFQGAFLPLDDDPLPELYVVNDFGWRYPNSVHEVVDGAIVDVPSLGLGVSGTNMGLGLGDVNEDGIVDVLVPAWEEVFLQLSARGAGWYAAADAVGLRPSPVRGQEVGWGASLADVDHDGDLDAYVAFGRLDEAAFSPPNPAVQRDGLWVREGARFVDRAGALGIDAPGVGRGVVVADLTGDGWLDVMRRDLRGPTTISRARCGDGAWLVVRPRHPGGPNPFGVGVEVRVEDGGRTWRRWLLAGGESFQSQGPYEVHVGLGDRDRVDRVSVHWPDGAVDVVQDVPTRRRVTVARQDAAPP